MSKLIVRNEPATMKFSTSYAKAFQAWGRSGGASMSAAMYEGAATDGGYAVPVVVFGEVTQLAPPDGAVRSLATVMVTTTDIKFPVKLASGSAAAKAESGSSDNVFAGTTPTLTSVPLSAFMVGVVLPMSLEIFGDAPSLTIFLQQDAGLDVSTYEENKFINGSGNGEAQGLLGNVGAGVTEEPDALGNLVSIDGTYRLLGQLKAAYHPNAKWLMTRATGVLIRKAQETANLFLPVWTSTAGTDYLHGYEVAYSDAMPTAARGACPVLFGDFALAYIVGDRDNSGLKIKVVDQTRATEGVVDLIVYKRVDGRVRRPEAVQGYNIAVS